MTPSRTRRPRRFACPERGQATVEFALILPLAVFLLLAVLQTALIVRDYVGVVHAAREAAARGQRRPRSCRGRPRRAVVCSRDARVDVGTRPRIGGPIRVEVTVTSRTNLPMVGALFPDPDLHATATMRTER